MNDFHASSFDAKIKRKHTRFNLFIVYQMETDFNSNLNLAAKNIVDIKIWANNK